MSDADFHEIDDAVQRWMNGDESARLQLIQLSQDRLKRLTRKMLKGFPVVRRWEDTDDVFQRASIRLWTILEKVHPEDSRHFFNLAALQVRRELIDLARSLSGPQSHAANHESLAGAESQPCHDTPADSGTETYEASSLASWTEFHEKVQHLDPVERETFELIWYQGLSQQSVALILEISQKSVSRHWQKARRNLYHLLGRQLPQ